MSGDDGNMVAGGAAARAEAGNRLAPVVEEPPSKVLPLSMVAVKQMVDTMEMIHREQLKEAAQTWRLIQSAKPVSYTHLTLPPTPYV
mgnify:CR=1 FL=1